MLHWHGCFVSTKTDITINMEQGPSDPTQSLWVQWSLLSREERRSFWDESRALKAREEQATGAPEPRAGPFHEFRLKRALEEAARKKLMLAFATWGSRFT